MNGDGGRRGNASDDAKPAVLDSPGDAPIGVKQPADMALAPTHNNTPTPAPTSSRPTGGIVQTMAMQQSMQFRASRGLLTDPKSLKEYEEAIPGSGDKILAKFFEQTENEQAHRHSMEHEELTYSRKRDLMLIEQASRGQLFALLVALSGFVLVGYLAFVGQPAVAGTVGTVDIAALVGAFIYGRKKSSDDASKELGGESLPPVLPRSSKPPGAPSLPPPAPVPNPASGPTAPKQNPNPRPKKRRPKR